MALSSDTYILTFISTSIFDSPSSFIYLPSLRSTLLYINLKLYLPTLLSTPIDLALNAVHFGNSRNNEVKTGLIWISLRNRYNANNISALIFFSRGPGGRKGYVSHIQTAPAIYHACGPYFSLICYVSIFLGGIGTRAHLIERRISFRADAFHNDFQGLNCFSANRPKICAPVAWWIDFPNSISWGVGMKRYLWRINYEIRKESFYWLNVKILHIRCFGLLLYLDDIVSWVNEILASCSTLQNHRKPYFLCGLEKIKTQVCAKFH